ncbi:MAG: hypothetical protein GXP08_16865, partial [Gammaproteobacteria bacterium]|nr:hypothetical protein [Gammaproteobacteria bacterium]
SGVLAFSRILNDQELIIIANCSAQDKQSIFVIVDHALNRNGSLYQVLFSNKSNPPPPGPVQERHNVSVLEVDGGVSTGPVRALQVAMQPMEVQILGLK